MERVLERVTTIKVFRNDALLLKQILNFLEMHDRSFNQSEFMHEMLGFMLEHEQDFFREIEKQQKRHARIMEEWMQVMSKRMRKREVSEP